MHRPLLTKVAHFRNFYFAANNDFTGQFPSLANFTQLDALFIAGNRFSGTLPSSVLHLPNLTKFHFHQNELKGDLDFLCHADNIYTLRQDISLIDVRADCKAKDEVVCKCCTDCCCDDTECCTTQDENGFSGCSELS